MMARVSDAARARAERRAELLRAEIAEGWRAIGGVEVTVEGGEVIVEGRRLRLRSFDTGLRLGSVPPQDERGWDYER